MLRIEADHRLAGFQQVFQQQLQKEALIGIEFHSAGCDEVEEVLRDPLRLLPLGNKRKA